MVPKALIQFGGVIFFILLDLNHLRRASFSCAGVGRTPKARSRSPFNVDPDQSGLDDGNILGLGDYFSHRLMGRCAIAVGHDVYHFPDQVGFHLDAVVGQCGCG